MFRSKILALIVSFLLAAWPSRLFAEEPDVVIVSKPGVVVPIAGILFSNKAYAELKAKQEMQTALFERELKYSLEVQKLELSLATTTTAIALKYVENLQAEREKFHNIEIELLQKQVTDNSQFGFVETVIISSAIVTATAVAIISVVLVLNKSLNEVQ